MRYLFSWPEHSPSAEAANQVHTRTQHLPKPGAGYWSASQPAGEVRHAVSVLQALAPLRIGLIGLQK